MTALSRRQRCRQRQRSGSVPHVSELGGGRAGAREAVDPAASPGALPYPGYRPLAAAAAARTGQGRRSRPAADGRAAARVRLRLCHRPTGWGGRTQSTGGGGPELPKSRLPTFRTVTSRRPDARLRHRLVNALISAVVMVPNACLVSSLNGRYRGQLQYGPIRSFPPFQM